LGSEQPHVEKHRGRHQWLVVVLGVLAALVVLAVSPLALILGQTWAEDSKLPRGFTQDTWAAHSDERQYLADDLVSRRLLIGLSPEQCDRLLGSPDSTGAIWDLFSREPFQYLQETPVENVEATVTIPGETTETVRSHFSLPPTEPFPETYSSWVLGPERSLFSIDSEELVVGFSSAGKVVGTTVVQD
jgi:hypothetical protein